MRARLAARVAIFAGLVGVIVAAPSPARASHHLWVLSQIFSNASGTVQFIVLTENAPETGEDAVSGVTVTAGGHTFTFNANLPTPGTDVHKWILLGTPGYAALPGVPAPDFTIPAGFLPTGMGTVIYAGADTFPYGAMPVDGHNALHKSSGGTITTSVNTPENFALQTGTVNLVVPTLPAVGIALLVGALLLAGSGLLSRRRVKSA
jgi:hypothetical protein